MAFDLAASSPWIASGLNPELLALLQARLGGGGMGGQADPDPYAAAAAGSTPLPSGGPLPVQMSGAPAAQPSIFQARMGGGGAPAEASPTSQPTSLSGGPAPGGPILRPGSPLDKFAGWLGGLGGSAAPSGGLPASDGQPRAPADNAGMSRFDAPAAAAPPAPTAAATPPLRGVAPLSLNPGDFNEQLPPNSTPTANLALPPAAVPAPAAASAPAAAPASAVPSSSLVGRLNQGLANNPNLLMAIGAGLAGSKTYGEGISRALSAAPAAGQLDIRNQRTNQTVDALVKRGVPPEFATAVATNPEILKSVAPQIFGAKKLQFQKVTDPATGIEHTVAYNEANPSELYRVDLQRGLVPTGSVGAAAAPGAPTVRVTTPQQALALKPGTPFIDPNGVPRIR